MAGVNCYQLPYVSVLLPVRNGERTVASALRSVQKQVGVAWECICVDDNSADNTWHILQQYVAKDPRIRVFRSPGRGIVPALQFGFTRCRGHFVARMDADDAMHPLRLLRQTLALEADPSLAGLGSRVLPFPRTRLRRGFKRYVHWLDHLDSPEAVARERFIECPIVHPTLMWRRSTLERHPYRETTWPEDYDLVLRVVEAGERVTNLPQRLYYWRIHAEKTSLTHHRYSQEQFARCKAHYLARGPLKPWQGYLLWGYGPTARRLFRALSREDKLPCAIIEVHPRRLGQSIRGIKVLPPEAISDLPHVPLIVSVAHPAARTAIRQFLSRTTRVEGRDWFFAA